MTVGDMVARRPPTGPYQTQHWPVIVEAALERPQLRLIAENYLRTGHPACLNGIMTNADFGLWMIYYCGKRPQSAKRGAEVTT